MELKSAKGIQNLKGWKVYSIPTDYAFAKSLAYNAREVPKDMPAFYRATFQLQKKGDTFIDLSNWNKGFVYVNGYNIGRYWNIGPQQTLYMPGCWLKEGENEIIILDLASPKEASTRGLCEPILDVLAPGSAYSHRKQGENLDLTGETATLQGVFSPGHGWQQVKFGKPVATRYFCLEALSSYDGNPYAAIAELEILGEDGKNVSRQHWKVVYADSEETDDANNIASNVFDLQESTIWHTNYSKNPTPFPHQIVIDLGELKTITGFSYLPRPEANKTGMIKDYKAYLKESSFKK